MTNKTERKILEAFILMEYGYIYLIIHKIIARIAGNSIQSLFKTAFKGSNYNELSDAGCRFTDILDRILAIDKDVIVETRIPYEIIWPWCRKHKINLHKATRMVFEIKNGDAIVTGELKIMDCTNLTFI